MVVAAAGARITAKSVRLAEEHWSGRPTTSSTDFPVDFDRAVFRPQKCGTKTYLNLGHMSLWRLMGAEWTSPYSVPLMVLQTLVGQWDPAWKSPRLLGNAFYGGKRRLGTQLPRVDGVGRDHSSRLNLRTALRVHFFGQLPLVHDTLL